MYPPLRRIQDVADEVGLTSRAIRYYEEMGLLIPAARSGGSHRLYDESDVERLRAIQALRDDAGFSIGDIARLLEDTDQLARSKAAYRSAENPAERLRIASEGLARVDRQIALLGAKIERLRAMRDDARARRARIIELVAQLEPEVGASTTKARPGSVEAPA
jgi:MerR family transcriptional regulator, repressor of the yfmOP operon